MAGGVPKTHSGSAIRDREWFCYNLITRQSRFSARMSRYGFLALSEWSDVTKWHRAPAVLIGKTQHLGPQKGPRDGFQKMRKKEHLTVSLVFFGVWERFLRFRKSLALFWPFSGVRRLAGSSCFLWPVIHPPRLPRPGNVHRQTCGVAGMKDTR